MEIQKKVYCECETKLYSIPEIKLYTFPKDLKHFIPEYLKENWNYIVYNTKCIHLWIALLKYVSRRNLPSITEKKLIYYLTKDIISVSIYDTSVFNCIPDVDVYLIEDDEDEDVNKDEFLSCSVEKYEIHLENYLECFKNVKGLPIGLSNKSVWDNSIHIGHKNFQYWIYLLYKILHLNENEDIKELLIYNLHKDLFLYNAYYEHVLIFNPVIYHLEHRGGLISLEGKLKYKGHYMFPNMCNCSKNPISSDEWKLFSSPSLHFILNYPIFLNNDKKWTYAVYNCTCIHKLVGIIKSIMDSKLNYWDEVIVMNKLVSDVIQLYPLNEDSIFLFCECDSCDVYYEEEDNYFDKSKYVNISDFPLELKTNNRWNTEVDNSCHNLEYFKKVVRDILSPTYRYKYGNAEKILHQFCKDLVILFCKKFNDMCTERCVV